jgi:hypothetical protein
MRDSDRERARGSRRFEVYSGQGGSERAAAGRARAYVTEEFSPPAVLVIPREEYQVVRVGDLLRIRDGVVNTPKESVAWLNAVWALVSLAASTALATLTLDQHAPLSAFSMWMLAGGLTAAACFCGVAHISVNLPRHRARENVVDDLERTLLRPDDEPATELRSGSGFPG